MNTKPSMAEMVFADAVKRDEKHAEFRQKLGSRAADLHNAWIQGCIEKGEEIVPEDLPILWNAAMAAAREELAPVYSGQPLPSRFPSLVPMRIADLIRNRKVKPETYHGGTL